MARTSTRAALAGLVLALASACGGDDGGGGDGASPSGGDKSGPEAFDPCALLEVAEVEEQFGRFGPVGEPTARGSFCDYPVGEGATPPGITLGVLGFEPGGDAESQYATMRADAVAPVDVPVGDEAYADGPDWLYVRSEGNLFTINAIAFDPSTGPHTDRLTTLAALIAERLPPDFVGP